MTRSLKHSPIPLILSLLLLFCLLGAVLYEYAAQKTAWVLEQLPKINPEKTEPKTLNEALLQLQSLADAREALEKSHILYYRWLGIRSAAQREQTIDQQYQNLLTSFYIPYLQQLHYHSLTHLNVFSPQALYDAVRVTLILNQELPWQAAFVKSWFKQQLTNSLAENPRAASLWLQPLHYAADHHLLRWQTSKQQLAESRKSFQQLPKATLSLLLLINDYPRRWVSLDIMLPHSPWLNAQSLKIPLVFSPSIYQRMIREHIPALTTETLLGDAITGPLRPPKLTLPQTNQLIQQVQMAYQNQYRLAWSQTLTQLKLHPLHRLTDVETLLTDLQDPHNALWSTIQILNQEATRDQEAPSVFTNFLAQNRGYAGYQAALFTLKQEINPLNQSKDPLKASFEQAQHRLQDLSSDDDTFTLSLEVAHQVPEPLQTWLQKMTLDSWRILLTQAAQYIDQRWQEEIFSDYQSQIQHRYPLEHDARAELSLPHFQAFFAPGGNLDRFFTHYLSAFVDQEESGLWTWKNSEGFALPIKTNTLDIFLHATAIRKLFFADPSAPPQLSFTLTAQRLKPPVQKAIFNIAGQMWIISPGQTPTQAFSWPGPIPDFVTIRLVDAQGKTPTQTYTGPWAWFHALDDTQLIRKSEATLALKLTWTNDEVNLVLNSNAALNPFTPGLLSPFVLPQHLT